MSEEENARDMIIEQRKMLLSLMGTVYPNARAGASFYSSMLGPFPEYTKRYALRDFAYLEEKGYIAQRATSSRSEPKVWHEAMWAATARGFEISQRITRDPALEI